MVPKALLLLGYFFLFSVQICFRYSPQSLDLDAYSSTSFVHGKGVGAQGAHLHARTAGVHHILNKRFEPVVEMAMPAQEIGVAPLYMELRRTYPLVRAYAFSRSILTVPLRGPPSMA